MNHPIFFWNSCSNEIFYFRVRHKFQNNVLSPPPYLPKISSISSHKICISYTNSKNPFWPLETLSKLNISIIFTLKNYWEAGKVLQISSAGKKICSQFDCGRGGDWNHENIESILRQYLYFAPFEWSNQDIWKREHASDLKTLKISKFLHKNTKTRDYFRFRSSPSPKYTVDDDTD